MNKTILLSMQENGDIFIFVEEEKKITISANDRTLNARKVYEALMYEPDDTFQVQKRMMRIKMRRFLMHWSNCLRI